MPKSPFQALFQKPKVEFTSFIPQYKKLWEENPNNQPVKDQYVKALLDYARELISSDHYDEAKPYLKRADELTDKKHHLKFLISCSLLQINEYQASISNSVKF